MWCLSSETLNGSSMYTLWDCLEASINLFVSILLTFLCRIFWKQEQKIKGDYSFAINTKKKYTVNISLLNPLKIILSHLTSFLIKNFENKHALHVLNINLDILR